MNYSAEPLPEPHVEPEPQSASEVEVEVGADLTPTPPPRGRRPGRPDVRGQILEVARDRFRREGYEAVTMRSLAADAGVDAALISYYFGSKSGLFAAVLELTLSPTDIMAGLLRGDLETLPQRLLPTLLAAYDNPETGVPLIAGIRAAMADPELAALIRGGIHRQLVDRLAERIGGADAQRRAGIFVTQIGGLIFTRYLLAAEPVASMRPDEIVRAFGPSLRTTLFGPVPATAARAPDARFRFGTRTGTFIHRDRDGRA
ncbi:TetR family transcriptional regulator [Frankia sp. AiPa1]|uniref:TetR/AcrR family transcriptional regulator n=1 Tax=Frankia sp. AiPa1 TaxID=573492 RepID=UPI00202B0A71|nr:TetR family transcriptional regulator [Frankia sp. AiPa1]MCL9761275.1 TetR family transcriptional regulator [Frankia sp. AiPa1]